MIRGVETVKSVYAGWKPIGRWSGRPALRCLGSVGPLRPLRCDVLL